MHRRSFLKNSSLTALLIPAGSMLSTVSAREHFADELDEITIDDLQRKMQTGAYTSASLTKKYLARIDALNKKGPALNAVIEINPDATSIAAKLDQERSAGKVRGPLHGIPVLVKDNIDTGDKMMTTAGSIALIGNHAKDDAFIIKQLREAGAVLLGKTNLSEWSNFRSSNATSGWSSRGGQTRNPCVLDRNPSGSSSGSAVAVAANLCAAAIGTETDGSIISPASQNGVVGIKPTVGLLSRSGIIPISKTQDTAGPIARTVRDAAILLGVLTGVDDRDEQSRHSNGKANKDYTQLLKQDALQGKRIGVDTAFFSGNPTVVSLYKDAIALMASKGATIVEVELMKRFYGLDYEEYHLFQYEFKQGVNDYLSKANGKVKSLAELIAFNNEHKDKAMPWFGQDILVAAEAKGNLQSGEYQAIISRRPEVQQLVNGIMKQNRLHAICSTSSGLPGLIDLVNGDYSTGFYSCPPAATTGFPHVTVPMGKVHELPIGLSFMSGPYTEAELLGIAYSYEQASKKREAPKFIVTSIPI